MQKKGVLSVFDICLILGIGVTNILYSVFSGSVDVLGSLTGIAGVLCVVLVAKGSIWNYLFGLVNVSLYAWISFKTGLYGDAALNAPCIIFRCSSSDGGSGGNAGLPPCAVKTDRRP